MDRFRGSQHAAIYSKFRPTYPAELLGLILDFLSEKIEPPFKHAVDVGCGSGQSTEYLASSFQRVTGCDVSEAQVEQANKNEEKSENVTYRFGRDTDIPCPDGGAELVTAATAAHWFDLEGFCREADRVLCPNGCLAIYGYRRPHIIYKEKTDQASSLIISELHEFFQENGHWDKRRRIVDSTFWGQPFPYKEGKRYIYSLHFDWATDVEGLIGYLESWSSFQSYIRKNADGKELMNNVKDRLLVAMDNPETGDQTPLILRYPVYLILARKPCETEG